MLKLLPYSLASFLYFLFMTLTVAFTSVFLFSTFTYQYCTEYQAQDSDTCCYSEQPQLIQSLYHRR